MLLSNSHQKKKTKKCFLRTGLWIWTSVLDVQENYPVYPPPFPIIPHGRLLPQLGSFSRSLWHILSSHLSQHIKLLMLPPASHTTLLPCQAQVSQIECCRLFRGWGQQVDLEMEAETPGWYGQQNQNYFNYICVIAFSMQTFFMVLKPDARTRI